MTTSETDRPDRQSKPSMPPPRRRRTAHGGSILAILVIASMALVVSGCGYLTSFLLPPPFPNESFDPGLLSFSPDESFPGDFDPDASPMAVWTHGTATVTIAGKTATLTRLNGNGVLTGGGGRATWTDGNGWYLQVFGASKNELFAGAGFLVLDKIADGQHWTSDDPATCKLTVTKTDTSGFTGAATCTDLRWTDYMMAFDPFGGPALVKGEPAFDATITFEALP